MWEWQLWKRKLPNGKVLLLNGEYELKLSSCFTTGKCLQELESRPSFDLALGNNKLNFDPSLMQGQRLDQVGLSKTRDYYHFSFTAAAWQPKKLSKAALARLYCNQEDVSYENNFSAWSKYFCRGISILSGLFEQHWGGIWRSLQGQISIHCQSAARSQCHISIHNLQSKL